MGGLGDVYHKRRPGGLGEYLKPGALDQLTHGDRRGASTGSGKAAARLGIQGRSLG